MPVTPEVCTLIQRLEESLWLTQTRFDLAYLDGILANDFCEFGRSGRIYTRRQVLSVAAQPINVVLPLRNFTVVEIAPGVVLATYGSEVAYDEVEFANRSSLWAFDGVRWKLHFHQGTPCGPWRQ